jgi:hypothetical protein
MKTIRYFFILCLILLTESMFAQTPYWEWANSAYNPSTGTTTYVNSPGGLCTDLQGNTYLTGSFRDSVRFANSFLFSPGQNSMFMVSHDPQGNLRWAKQPSSHSLSNASCVARGPSGMIYNAGSYSDSLTLNGMTIYATPGMVNNYLLNTDPLGNMIWGTTISARLSANVKSVSNTVAGSFCAAGLFKDTLWIGPDTLIGPSQTSIYLAQLNTLGQLQHHIVVTGSLLNSPLATQDALGNIYLAGAYSGATSFGASLSGRGSFIAKYDASLTLQWVINLQGLAAQVSRIEADAGGALYATGNFNDSINVNGIALDFPGISHNVFTAKFESSGACMWAKRITHTLNNVQINSYGLAVSANRVLITGNFTFNIVFNGIGYSSQNNPRDIFVAQYDPQGNEISFNTGGSTFEDYSYDAAMDPFENVYITGSLVSPSYFGTITVPDSSFYHNHPNTFVAKLNLNGPLQTGSLILEGRSILYPDPASGVIYLRDPSLGKNETVYLEIEDSHGAIVFRSVPKTQSDEMTINCSSFSPGIYFVRLIGEQGISVKKFVKDSYFRYN